MFLKHQEQKHLQRARELRNQSNCPKARTAVVIAREKKEISIGWNSCQPEGFCREEKICLENCPRAKIVTTQSYEICHIVHAEARAILNVLPALTPEILADFESHKIPTRELIQKNFLSEELTRLRGSALYLSGHTYACDGCKEMCRLVGITSIVVDSVVAEEVAEYYQKLGKAVPLEPRSYLINGKWHQNK